MKFETGKMGRQASGSVTAQMANTIVYSTVCKERESSPVDFTPLRVDYFARYSAVGQTVGAFHRRDSRGDDTEILVARLIDRPIRPMIAEGWQHETQILAWTLSYDKINSPEPLAICAASAAMCVSEVPMNKPIAGVEVGLAADGSFIVNPTNAQKATSPLNITVAGTKEGILMIEGAGDFVPEDIMIQAIAAGHAAVGVICDGIAVLQRVAGKKKKVDTLRKAPSELLDAMDQLFGTQMVSALSIGDKQERGGEVARVERLVVDRFCTASAPVMKAIDLKEENSQEEESADDVIPVALDLEDAVVVDEPIGGVDEVSEDEASELTMAVGPVGTQQAGAPVGAAGYKYDSVDVKVGLKKLLVRCLRRLINSTGRRSDGRGTDEVRPLYLETAILPMAHGSSLFTRGETQALATATLGSRGMEARFETLDELSTKRFYLQYRFPPSSVGEVGRVGGVNRREVGHGNLAERALLPSIPAKDAFPYSIRAESLITESCGSSSMATVCGCCLAMLDAGVPVKSHVAGVAMGLILGETIDEEPIILTDILGLEDALGTMDFKVAGNETGVTSFQLDIKSEGLTIGVLQRALDQAKRGRLHVLGLMRDHLASPRALKDTIPKILEFAVPPETLGKVIGPKGATVQKLIETYGVVNINLEDSGSIQVESFSSEKNDEVREAIMKIVSEAQTKDSSKGGRGRDKPEPEGPPPEVGEIYRECEIISVHQFGCFVEMLPGWEGLVHVSELDMVKIAKPEAVFSPGQKLDVKYLGKNDKGQMRLSRRAVMLRDAPPGTSSLPEGELEEAVVEEARVMPEVGTVFEDVEIKSVHPYGVFVEVLPGLEGLVHSSELDLRKISKVSSSFTIGQKINVKFISVNEQGKMELSRKALMSEADIPPIADPPVVGTIYRSCPVKSVQKFGVFVEVLPGYEGLVHASELDVKRVNNVETEFTIGQLLDVKYLENNDKGQMRLSRKAVLLRDSTSASN